MEEPKKPTKLMTWRQVVMVGIATCGGAALFVFLRLDQRGYISKLDIVAMIFTIVFTTLMLIGIAWWANRPEKGA